MRRKSPRFLLRDRDGTYGAAVDAVFEAVEPEVLLSAPRVPRTHAHGERISGSIRREMPDHVLIGNETHAHQVLAAHPRHYNAHRPHQARQRLPPDAEERLDVAVHALDVRRVLQTQAPRRHDRRVPPHRSAGDDESSNGAGHTRPG